MAKKIKKIRFNGVEYEICGSGISGAKAADGTILNVVDGWLQVGNLAAVDTVGEAQLDNTLLGKINAIKDMNDAQFSEINNEYALTAVYCGTSEDI